MRFDLHPSRADRPTRAGPSARLEEPVDSQMMERDLARIDISLADVLAVSGHLVFVGAAGSGKTTVLRLLATVLAVQDAAAARAELGLVTDSPPLPVFVARA